MADEQIYGFLKAEVERIARTVREMERRLRNDINGVKNRRGPRKHNTAGKLVTELRRKNWARFAEHYVDLSNRTLGDPTGEEYDCYDLEYLSSVVSPLPVGTRVFFISLGGGWVLNGYDCDAV